MLLCTAIAVPSLGQTVRGPRYRGFVDGTYMKGNDGYYQSLNMHSWGLSTTHGCQFNSHIFVGGGLAYYHLKGEKDLRSYGDDYGCDVVPVYSDLRVQMSESRVSPFFDLKLGYTISKYGGFIASPSFGVRIGTDKRHGINLTVGYTALSGGCLYDDGRCYYTHQLSLSAGFDF